MVHDVRELATCIPTDNEAGRRARETRVIFSELTSVPAVSFSREKEREIAVLRSLDGATFSACYMVADNVEWYFSPAKVCNCNRLLSAVARKAAARDTAERKDRLAGLDRHDAALIRLPLARIGVHVPH